MKKNQLPWLALLPPLLLSGCSYFSKQSVIQGRDKHYLTANSIAPMRVPPGLASNGIQNDYPIPDRQYPDSQKSVSILPPGVGS